MAGFHETADWIRLCSGVVYFFLMCIMTALAIMKNRHNLRNKARGYAIRYKKYINCMILMAAAAMILCIGTIVPLVDQGETIRSSDHVRSQWGWWIAFALYNAFTLIVLGNYNHLATVGYLYVGFMSMCSGACAVFASINSGHGAWVLWITLGFIAHGASHFYVWAKSQRYYTLLPLGGGEKFGTGRHAMEDMILVGVSWTLLSLVWFFMILSYEISDVLVPVYLAEIAYGLLLVLHWSYLSSCIVMFFIDEMYQDGRGGPDKTRTQNTHDIETVRKRRTVPKNTVEL